MSPALSYCKNSWNNGDSWQILTRNHICFWTFENNVALFEMWPVTFLYHIFVPMICCKILHLGFYDNRNAFKDYPIVSINRLKIAFFRNLDQNIQSWSEEHLKNETIFKYETVSRFAIYDAAGQKKTLTLLCSCFTAVAAKCFTVCIFKCCGQDPFGQVQLAKLPLGC